MFLIKSIKAVEKDRLIRGDILKIAFNELDVLGRPLKEAIIQHVENQGIKLTHQHSYKLYEIEDVLGKIFGTHATSLIVQRLWRGIWTQDEL